MNHVSQGFSEVNWSDNLVALGSTIIHLFGPSAFEGSVWDLPFPTPQGLRGHSLFQGPSCLHMVH